TKEGETLGIIGISVELCAREVFWSVNEVDGRVARAIDVDNDLAFAEVEGNSQLAGEAFRDRLDFLEFVSRHNDADRVSESSQSFWQCSCYVCQTSCFCIRDD